MRGVTDRKVGFELKDWSLVFLNQPVPFIPFRIKIRLPKPSWENLLMKKDRAQQIQ